MNRVTAILLLLFSALSGFGQQASDTLVVYFNVDRSHISEIFKQEIDLFIDRYRQSGSEQLVILGHCDVMGSNSYNDRLSEQRTLAVQDYLLKKGLSASAITLRKGYGERLPVNDNRSVEERSLNRRVELIITPGDPKKKVSYDPKKSKDSVRVFSKTNVEKVKEGAILRLQNINFYAGRHFFMQRSLPNLYELLDVMRAYPRLVIEIQGHICCGIGMNTDGEDIDTHTMDLSVNRARAVYNYLVDNGIDPKRMTYRGFGSLFPLVNPEKSEEDRLANRRVEIKIIRK